MIITSNCKFCMWMNDNNDGPCRKCGGHTEMKMVNGRWKEVTIKAPDRVTNSPADSRSDK